MIEAQKRLHVFYFKYVKDNTYPMHDPGNHTSTNQCHMMLNIQNSLLIIYKSLLWKVNN